MAQKAQVDWSETDKKSTGTGYLRQIINGQGEELITLQIKTGGVFSVKSTPTLTRYDRHFQQLLTKEPLKGNSNVEISSLDNFNGNLFLFTRALASKWTALSYTVQAVPIDPVTLEAGTPKDLVTFDGKGKRLAAAFYTSISPGHTNVLLFANEPFNDNDDKQYYLGVWDNKLNKQWDRVITLPSPKFTDLRDHLVSNDGQVYLSCRQYEKELTKLPFGKVVDNGSAYQYKVFVYSQSGTAPSEYTVDLKGKFVHEAALRFDNSGHVVIVGLYKNNFAGKVSGSFSAILDQNSQQFIVKQMEQFPAALLPRIAVNGCAFTDLQDPGLDPAFKMVGANTRTDGTIDLLSEFNNESHHSSVNLATHTMMDETTYRRYDVLVVSFKKDGKIIYTHLPKKQEESPFWSHISIRYMNRGNDLLIFYNDNKKNLASAGDPSLGADQIEQLGNSVFVMATVNETGAVQRQALFSNDDPEMMAEMGFCEPIDLHSMTLFVSKMRTFAREKYQLGLLTLN